MSPESGGFHLRFGVGEEALSPVRGDLAGDRGWVVEARARVGVFSSPVREYQSKRLKLFCLIKYFKKTNFQPF